MYYLVVQNLDVVRCIHKDVNDVYRDGMSFSCTPDFECPAREMVREIRFFCSENPAVRVRARVYHSPGD